MHPLFTLPPLKGVFFQANTMVTRRRRAGHRAWAV